jgi:hypothetical protein
MESVENQPAFRMDMSPPSSGSKNEHRLLLFSLTYSYTLKMEETCPAETQVDFQRITVCSGKEIFT